MLYGVLQRHCDRHLNLQCVDNPPHKNRPTSPQVATARLHGALLRYLILWYNTFISVFAFVDLWNSCTPEGAEHIKAAATPA
jgi:hypothetical protein